MAYTQFDEGGFSRRSILKGGALVAGGGMLATLPFGSALLAHDVSEAWPRVAAEIESYLAEKKVANMIATFRSKKSAEAYRWGQGGRDSPQGPSARTLGLI